MRYKAKFREDAGGCEGSRLRGSGYDATCNTAQREMGSRWIIRHFRGEDTGLIAIMHLRQPSNGETRSFHPPEFCLINALSRKVVTQTADLRVNGTFSLVHDDRTRKLLKLPQAGGVEDCSTRQGDEYRRLSPAKSGT